MSAATPRGELLLRDGDPRPFVLIECERHEGEQGESEYRFAVSWGDQIDDDDVPDVLADLLTAMTGADRVALAELMDRT